MQTTHTTRILEVKGMNCPACARKVTEAIQSVPGVSNIHVALGEATATFSTESEDATRDILSAVRQAGYRAMLSEDGQPLLASRDSWKLTVVVGSLITIALMAGEWGLGLGGESWFRYAAFALSGIVQMYCGARFYSGAWSQLKRGASNMDTLVALGSTTAFAFSTWGLFCGWSGHLYFMESAAIITLVSLGHFIESRVASRAESSLNALLNLAPEKALRRNIDGSEKEVSVSELDLTHEVILKPGDKIPVDGKVIEGASSVDESMLTGESLPRNKQQQDKVYAGTINLDGQLVIQVTATGQSTALARIIEIVQRAQNSRANIQRIGDRVSSVFVPIVIGIALLTALWWGLAYDSALKTATTILPFLRPEHFPASPLEAAFVHLAGVLIIACPCAMGLATPAAIMAGVNAAARRGILIRDGEALEKTGTLTTIVFDKTGTLTAGRLAVDPDTTLSQESQIATTRLTERSRHPISLALFNHLSSGTRAPAGGYKRPDMRNWIELRGRGIEADIGYGKYRLGAIPWLEECGVKIDAEEEIHRLQATGRTVVGLANANELIQLYALRDKLRNAVPDIVRTLRAQNLQPAMITGDNRITADAIAHEAGIESTHVHAGVRPEGKAKLISELQKDGQRLAFVGDGINDAPALEQADLGIAVASASDVARESADIILLKSDIQTIPQAIDLSQATLRTIKQNLFWAFFYNAAAIPIAVLGFVSPIICAAAMGFSDLIVIGNSLRLLRR